MDGTEASPLVKSFLHEQRPGWSETQVSRWKPEGISVSADRKSGIIKFTSSYHLLNDTLDRHLVTASTINVGNIDEPVTGPRTGYIERYQMAKDEAEFQPFIDNLANMNPWVIMRFLHTLNNRKVRVVELQSDPYKPATRQQRRAENWQEREHYKIYLPATLTIHKAMEQATSASNCWDVTPHDRRGHLRTDRYGRKRIVVRPTKVKGGYQGKWFPIYDSHAVGMAGLEVD